MPKTAKREPNVKKVPAAQSSAAAANDAPAAMQPGLPMPPPPEVKFEPADMLQIRADELHAFGQYLDRVPFAQAEPLVNILRAVVARGKVG